MEPVRPEVLLFTAQLQLYEFQGKLLRVSEAMRVARENGNQE